MLVKTFNLIEFKSRKEEGGTEGEGKEERGERRKEEGRMKGGKKGK